ncbi:MAG: 16S rRNA (cytosine(1402)-N(4))-methyltransferase RsmH [Candidatus Paceibacterota bacterium]
MTKHIPVLLPQVMQYLDVQAGDTVLDCTVGSGGYARAITACLDETGTFLGIDADKVAIETTRSAIADFAGKVCLKAANFRTAATVLESCETESLDAAVFDLGFRSEQLEMERGFSFQEEEAPLEMTFKHSDELSEDDVRAFDVVNHWDEEVLESILDGYGNEVHSQAIAAAIISARKEQPIKTTGQLVEIIRQAVPLGYRKGRLNPATRTFQALRMAVNDEVNALKEGLESVFAALAEDGRLVVVSFHSIEDRSVKEYFRYLVDNDMAETLTDRPVVAKREEMVFNPRSRSAKLRAIKKLS